MAGDTDALGGTIDPVIESTLNQNYAAVMGGMIQHFGDGVQMARKAYARLEGGFDFFASQGTGIFLQGIANMGIAQQILGGREVEAQPQQNNTPGWAGGPASASMLPGKVAAAGATG
jgi:hypothetical protein